MGRDAGPAGGLSARVCRDPSAVGPGIGRSWRIPGTAAVAGIFRALHLESHRGNGRPPGLVPTPLSAS